MLEIPNLNTVYEDEYITLLIHDIGGTGELLVMHADVIPSVNRNLLAHYFYVVEETFDALRQRGFEEIEAWVNSDEEMHYAQFFGFDEIIGELTVNKQTVIPSVFRLRKKL